MDTQTQLIILLITLASAVLLLFRTRIDSQRIINTEFPIIRQQMTALLKAHDDLQKAYTAMLLETGRNEATLVERIRQLEVRVRRVQRSRRQSVREIGRLTEELRQSHERNDTLSRRVADNETTIKALQDQLGLQSINPS